MDISVTRGTPPTEFEPVTVAITLTSPEEVEAFKCALDAATDFSGEYLIEGETFEQAVESWIGDDPHPGFDAADAHNVLWDLWRTVLDI